MDTTVFTPSILLTPARLSRVCSPSNLARMYYMGKGPGIGDWGLTQGGATDTMIGDSNDDRSPKSPLRRRFVRRDVDV